MRMVYQIESTDQASILHEIATIWRYTQKRKTRVTAENLLTKLRSLSETACMELVREVQKTYRLPDKEITIGELLAQARLKSNAQNLSGHDIMALERFAPDTRHMVILDVLTDESLSGYKGEKLRLFLTEQGYSDALKEQNKGFVKIKKHAKVIDGNLNYDRNDHER